MVIVRANSLRVNSVAGAAAHTICYRQANPKISMSCLQIGPISLRLDESWCSGQSVNRRWPETLVLYRTRPIPRRQVGSGRCAGRVRYSCLKEAARGEALMQIEWFWGDEKGLGHREWN